MSLLRKFAQVTFCALRFIKNKARFPNNSVSVSSSARVSWLSKISATGGGKITIGKRCEIHRGVLILTYGGNIEIGDDCSVNPYSILYGHGGLSVGRGVRIAAHCVVIPANHQFGDDITPGLYKRPTAKGITIGEFTWIGAGVQILDGVRIGRHAVIGAGSVVTKDVADGQRVGGAPARELLSSDN